METWHTSFIDRYVEDWNLVFDERHGCRPWWNVPLNDVYFRHNIVHHLGGAGFLNEMSIIVTRPHWISKRIKKDGFSLFAKDITFAIEQIKNCSTRSKHDSEQKFNVEELTIIKNALCLGQYFLREDEVEIWFQLYSRLFDSAQKYKAIDRYMKYLVENCPKPFLCFEKPMLLQATTGVDMQAIYDIPVSSIALTNDGRCMLAGCANGLLSRGAVQDVFEISTQWTAHRTNVSCVSLSEDGKFGVSGAQDGSLVVLETRRNQHVMEVQNAHSSNVTDVAFSKNEHQLVFSCSTDGSICCWNINDGNRVWRLNKAHDGKIIFGICGIGNGIIVSGGEDLRIRFWCVSSGTEKVESRIECGSPIRKLVKSSDSQFLAASFAEGVVRVWTISEVGMLQECFHLQIPFCSTVFVAPNGKLAVGTRTGSLLFYDVHKKSRIGGIEGRCGPVAILSLVQKKETTLCVSCCHRGSIRVFEITRQSRELARGTAKAICLSLNEADLIIGHKNGAIEVFHISSRTVSKTIDTKQNLNVLQTLRDGSRVAYGCDDGVVGIWDLWKNMRVGEWTAHDGVVCSIAVSEDGKHMGSSGADGAIRIWRLDRLDSRPLLIQSKEPHPLHSLFFGEECTRIMVTISNREASLWKNYRLEKSVPLEEVTHCAGKYEVFQELGRQLSIHKKTVVAQKNRLFLVDRGKDMVRVGSFEANILPKRWTFSLIANTLCVVGEDSCIRFAKLTEDDFTEYLR